VYGALDRPETSVGPHSGTVVRDGKQELVGGRRAEGDGPSEGHTGV
jgi:hypothetical protein